jgi:hypothetical protein
MRLLVGISVLAVSFLFFAPPFPEVPTGFDNKTNGLVDDAMHAASIHSGCCNKPCREEG